MENWNKSMKWIKHGQIFNPLEHKLPDDACYFAQSPQTLICQDFVRIYFSTRSLDSNGKFLSRIAFVDMNNDLTTIMKVSSNTVIPLGDLGCFDEHGIFPMNVLRVKDSIYGYTCGWSRRSSVSVETGIGLAISRDDGLTFQRIGPGPVLTSSLKEPCLVGDGFVKIIDGVFHMWYIFGTGWKQYSPQLDPDRTYKIGYAFSQDGINWSKSEGRQIISDRLGPNECQALPSVIDIDGKYHMFFCYRESYDFRQNSGRGYKIGHAWSNDLVHWVRDDQEPLLEGSSGEWDGEMQCYPHVFRHQEKVYLLYNGNEFGRYGFGLAELIP
jgi:hypothetical protein